MRKRARESILPSSQTSTCDEDSLKHPILESSPSDIPEEASEFEFKPSVRKYFDTETFPRFLLEKCSRNESSTTTNRVIENEEDNSNEITEEDQDILFHCDHLESYIKLEKIKRKVLNPSQWHCQGRLRVLCSLSVFGFLYLEMSI